MKHSQPDRAVGLRMPRSRGAVSGLLLVILGAWGALIPFVGPHFNFAYTPDRDWAWTTARGWLEVLPGIATVAGGLLLIVSRHRATAMFGGWLAVLAGAWFVVGRTFASTLNIADVGQPAATTDLKRALLEVTYFTGLGALIVFLGGAALARVAVRHARDVVVTEPAPMSTGSTPVAGAGVPAGEPVSYDESQARTDQSAAEPQPRRRFGGGLFRRRHHAGV